MYISDLFKENFSHWLCFPTSKFAFEVLSPHVNLNLNIQQKPPRLNQEDRDHSSPLPHRLVPWQGYEKWCASNKQKQPEIVNIIREAYTKKENKTWEALFVLSCLANVPSFALFVCVKASLNTLYHY